jgi:hypothetical protein
MRDVRDAVVQRLLGGLAGDSVLKHRIRCRLILVAGLAVAVGCGKDGGTGPGPDYSLSLAPAALTVVQGATGTATVTITRMNFPGAVPLHLGNAPVGVTGSFNPNPVAPTGTSSTLTVSVGAAVTPGIYNLTVNGTGSPGSRSTVLTLTVSPASDYTLSLSPATLTIVQGATGSTSVTITRTNFTGAVTLSLGDAPPGVTGSFDPAAPTGTSSTLTVSVSAAVAPGVYNLTVDGTATAGNRSTSLILTVSAAPDYALSLTPAVLTIAQGANATTTVTITRTNFTGAVTLSLGGAPAGVTGSFDPAAPTGTSSTLTVSVGADVASGVYNLTVNGTGSAGSRSTPLTLTVTAAGDYTLSLTPAELVIGQGASGTTTVTITRTDFTGAVTLTLENAPPGVTGVFNPTPALGASSQLTLSVGATVAPATYFLTVRGTAPGFADRTVTLPLFVESAYTLALNPPELVIGQGATGTTTVAITRTDFTGAVTLTLEDAPAGLTGVFNPTPAFGTSSQLTLSVGATVAPATYFLTVRGTAPGFADRAATLALFVCATAPSIVITPTSLTFTATQDAAGVLSQSVSISNGGTGTLSGLSVGTITYGAGASGWLEAPRLSATTAFPTAFVRVDVRTIDLQPGTYTATIPVQSAVASNSPQSVTVTYTVTPPAQCPTTGAPAISVGQTLTGTIATTDCVLTTGEHADVYLLTLAAETDVQIDLTTIAFTSGLRLRDAATGFIVAQGSTPLQSSRLTRRLRAGTFVIEAFARSATAVGTYQLSVAPAPVPIPLDGFWLGTAADGNTISLLIELNSVVFFFADLGRLDISGGLSCYLAISTNASAQIVANSFSFPWLSGTFNANVTGTAESPTTSSGTIGTMTLNEQPCETLTISGTIPSRTWRVTKR